MHTISQLKAGELTGIKRLSLSENLTAFPMEILTLADSLEILDLSNNQLTSLPDEIAQLPHLKIIFASNNLFTSLPKILGACPLLEMVGFKSNKITDVADESLPLQLRWLILTDNQITHLPETLGKRPRLQKLALAGNCLTHLPNSMDELINLELLRLSANQLAEFPKQLLSLPKLAWFAFSGNPFCQTELHIESVPEVASHDYILEEVLGQGASGIIYKASWAQPTQHELTNEIAVKVFKGEVTSDGYPQDELQACLKVGRHSNLVKSVAQVNEPNNLALIMELIPAHFKNLGLPPNFETCTRDTFEDNFQLPINDIKKIILQMEEVFNYLHDNQVCHGDLYAHNTLFDEESNIIFGDFGAASMYHMLPLPVQAVIKAIEKRALNHFIDDLLSICVPEEMKTDIYQHLSSQLK